MKWEPWMTPLVCPVSHCPSLPSHECLYISPLEGFSHSAFPSPLSRSFVFISCQDLTRFLELLHQSPYSNSCFQPHLPLRLRVRLLPEWPLRSVRPVILFPPWNNLPPALYAYASPESLAWEPRVSGICETPGLSPAPFHYPMGLPHLLLDFIKTAPRCLHVALWRQLPSPEMVIYTATSSAEAHASYLSRLYAIWFGYF